MCGIVGLVHVGTKTDELEKQRCQVSQFLFTEILRQTEERGKDATGVSVLFNDGNFFGLKGGIEASSFLEKNGTKENEYGGFLKAWSEYEEHSKIILGHCRKTSVGSTSDNNNNHPIKIKSIVGIHNGTLKNHDKIFTKLNSKRDGTVDSEAIMRLIYHYTDKGTEPFTIDNMSEVLRKLDGTYSVLAFNGNNPYQLVAFRRQRPMELWYLRGVDLLVIASELKFITNALNTYNLYARYWAPEKLPIITSSNKTSFTLTENELAVINIDEVVKEKSLLNSILKFKTVADKEKDWMDVDTYTANKSTYYPPTKANVVNKPTETKALNIVNTKPINTSEKTTTLVGTSNAENMRAFDPATKKFLMCPINTTESSNIGLAEVELDSGEVKELTKVSTPLLVVVKSPTKNIGTALPTIIKQPLKDFNTSDALKKDDINVINKEANNTAPNKNSTIGDYIKSLKNFCLTVLNEHNADKEKEGILLRKLMNNNNIDLNLLFGNVFSAGNVKEISLLNILKAKHQQKRM